MYSPFDKSIKDLQPDDLTVLMTVTEGWYVEYKSSLVNARSLAKVVSAFANTYGGWLFLGVKEERKDNPVAGSFPGILENELDIALQRLRQSTVEHLNPAPHFETKIIRGPCDEINLEKGSSIIAIEIPQSNTAPHVHKDGRIYRRAADSSEPKPETDRFVLDQLWRRGDLIRKTTRKWIEREPEFSEAEAKFPYLRLLLCVDPWRVRNPQLSASLFEIRNIFTSMENNLPSIVYDTVYPTAGGIIARQRKGNDPHDYCLTWRISYDLSCEVVVPLRFYSTCNLDELTINLNGYNHATFFLDIIKTEGHTAPNVVDLNILRNILTSIVSKYRRLLTIANSNGEYYYKARALNVWRVLPFIDSKTILDEFKAYGIPMILNSTETIPVGSDPDSFFSVPQLKLENCEQNEESIMSSLQAFAMFALTSIAFGVTSIPLDDRNNVESNITTALFDELEAAGKRAIDIQNRKAVSRI